MKEIYVGEAKAGTDFFLKFVTSGAKYECNILRYNVARAVVKVYTSNSEIFFTFFLEILEIQNISYKIESGKI